MAAPEPFIYEVLKNGTSTNPNISHPDFEYKLLDSNGSTVASKTTDPSIGLETSGDKLVAQNISFQNNDNSPWSNPYTLDVNLKRPSVGSWQGWCEFNGISPSGGDLEDGDTISFTLIAQTFSSSYAGLIDWIDVIDSGSALNFRFRLQDGTGTTFTDSGATVTISSAYNVDSTNDKINVASGNTPISFTNSSGSGWTSVSQMQCQVEGTTSGNWYTFATPTFTSVDVPNNATLNIDPIEHNLTLGSTSSSTSQV